MRIFLFFLLHTLTSAQSSSAPSLDIVPVDMSLGLGDSIQINCSANGEPEPCITWLKIVDYSNGNGESSPDNSNKPKIGYQSRVIQENSDKLTLNSVQLSDAGKYECKATNPASGVSVSKVFTITVHVGPRFAYKSSRTTAIRGTTAVLSCEAFGAKPIINTWHREGSNGKLEPIELSEALSQGNSLWKHSRYSSIEKNFDEDANRTLFELHIDSVELADSNVYVCKAVNEFGEDIKRNFLTIQDVPSAPDQFRVDQIWTRSASFRWNPPLSNGNSPLIRYIVQFWQDNETSSSIHRLVEENTSPSANSFQITDKLKPGTSYALRVIAENTLGRGVPSKTIEFTTKDEEPDASPVDIHVESRGTTTLRVSWKSPPRNHWNGRLKGYLLGYREINEDELSSSSLSRLGSSPPDLSQYNMKDIRFLGQPNDNYQQEFSLNDLKRGASYAIIIRAYNEAGPGPFSQPITSSTSNVDPPKAPRIRISTRKETGFVIKLDETDIDQTEITHYVIHYKDDNSAWAQRSFPVSTSNEYEMENLKSATWYEFYVQSESDRGPSAPSPIVMIKTLDDGSGILPKITAEPQGPYNMDDEGNRNAQYYGSYIVIPISVTVVIVVVVCAVAYVFVYFEDRKTNLLKTQYLSPSHSQNFQFFSPPSSSSHNPTIVSSENIGLSLQRYNTDGTLDRGQPCHSRATMSSKGPISLRVNKQPPIIEESPEYSTPYDCLNVRGRALSLPRIPKREYQTPSSATSPRGLPSQPIYINDSQNSLTTGTSRCKAEIHQDESNIYDYFTFHNL